MTVLCSSIASHQLGLLPAAHVASFSCDCVEIVTDHLCVPGRRLVVAGQGRQSASTREQRESSSSTAANTDTTTSRDTCT